jgi:hypothetical protein
VFAAGGGSGKTSLETGLAVHRALGKPFLGIPTEEGTTVIITAEDDREDFRRKIHAWKGVLGSDFDTKKISERVVIYDISGRPCALTEVDGKRYKVSEFARGLVDKVRTRTPDADLLIFETASRFGSGDESNGDMAAMVQALEVIARETRVAVLIATHISKQASRDRLKDAYVARGGSALTDNSRSVMVLSKLDAKSAKARFGGIPEEEIASRVIQLTLAKSNFSRGIDPLLLERVATPYRGGLVLKLMDESTSTLAKESAEMRRRQDLANIEQLIARLIEVEGGPVTQSKLRGVHGKLAKEMTGLGRSALTELLTVAVDGGVLKAVEMWVHGNKCVGYVTTRPVNVVRDAVPDA